MLKALKRHPLSLKASLRHVLVLTYAVPSDSLPRLVPSPLKLDTYRDWGFLAVSIIHADHLGPRFVPAVMRPDIVAVSYRVFVSHAAESGMVLRGRYNLRTDCNNALVTSLGNLLSHFRFYKSRLQLSQNHDAIEVTVSSRNAEADLRLQADLSSAGDSLPGGSVFDSIADAKRFAGPLPYTFDVEADLPP